MNTLKTILVVVDFSTGSRAALEQAARIAGLNGAHLHVLHVIDSAALTALAESRGSSFDSQMKTASEGASKALDRWMAQSRLPLGCEITIAVGTPLHEILEHERKFRADLLVAGISGAGKAAAGTGTVSTKLARKAGALVLLVRADQPGAFRKIIACIDFSATSRVVAEQARRVAVQDGASVDFLHVWQQPWISMPYGLLLAEAGAPLVAPTPEQRDAHVQIRQRELEEFVRDAAQGIQSAEVLVEAGSYGGGIAAHAQECKADLIVIGSKGRTNLKYVLLGSTAERLLTTLPCSLVVVKPPAEDLPP